MIEKRHQGVFNTSMDSMSENEAKLLQDLEALSVDPLVAQAYERAKEYEELINEVGGLTEDDKKGFVGDLDKQWAFTGAPLTITGYVTFADRATGELKREFYEDLVVSSNGFCIVDDHIHMGGERLAERYRVALCVLRTSDEGKTYDVGAVRIEEANIEYPAESPEMTERRLRYFHPEVMEELDTRILNCDNEDDAINALRGFELTVDPTDEANMQLANDIKSYLSRTLELDTALPYDIAVVGDVYIPLEDGRNLRAAMPEVGEFFATVTTIGLAPDLARSTNEVAVLMPCILANLHQSDRSKAPYQLLVPLTSLKDFKSVRRQKYEARQD